MYPCILVGDLVHTVGMEQYLATACIYMYIIILVGDLYTSWEMASGSVCLQEPVKYCQDVMRGPCNV